MNLVVGGWWLVVGGRIARTVGLSPRQHPNPQPPTTNHAAEGRP